MSQIVSVTGSTDSRAEIIFVSTNQGGGAFHINQTAEGTDSTWSGWTSLVPSSANLAMAASTLDGGCLVLAWLNGGVIWVAAANQPNGGLQPARALDTQNLRELKVATDKDGRVEFLALDNNGVLWSVAQSVLGSWDNMTIAVSNLMKQLPGTISDQAEQLFLSEAIICYHSRAFRAAIIMVWNLIYDHLLNWILADASRLTAFLAHIAGHVGPKKAAAITITKREDFEDLKESEVLDICGSAGLFVGQY